MPLRTRIAAVLIGSLFGIISVIATFAFAVWLCS